MGACPLRRVYGLADCNNFYASCERVFNPGLAGRPVVVLSNNDGCIVARSPEARTLGVPMGVPFHHWRAFLEKHGAAVFSSNYPLYGDLSRRVMDIIRQGAPEAEVYSIDEAFIAYTGAAAAAATAHARELRGRILRWTGIPVSVGLAPTRTLAKIANRLAKRDAAAGVVNLCECADMDAVLEEIGVEDVWGVGPQYHRFLRGHRIRTARELRDAHPDWVRRHMTVRGLRTCLELRGTPCIPLAESPPAKQAIGCSRTFGVPVEKLAVLEEAVADYTARAAEKLRAQQCAAGAVQVFLTTNPFAEGQPQYAQAATITLPVPNAWTPELAAAARRCLGGIYRPGYAYKKAGVLLFGITSASAVQMNLFEQDRPFAQQRRLMETVDRINARWGRQTIGIAAAGIGQPWKMQQAHLSPRYTTAWEELPRVRA
jgi:DNA polymerase V